MRFQLPKPQKGRSDWGWRLVAATPDELSALRDLFPDFKKAGSKPTRKERQEFLDRVKRLVEDRVYNVGLGRALADNRPWDFHIQEFLSYGKALGGLGDTAWAPGTYEIRRRTLQEYWTPRLQPKTLRDIRREAVLNAVRDMVNEGLAPSTINGRLTSLKSLMMRAEHLDFIEKNPLKGIYVKSRVQNPRGHFTPAELGRLFNETPIDDSMAYQLAYYCRYREGELRKLTVGSISWIERLISLPGMLDRTRAGTKNKKDAAQPIPERLWGALWDYCAGRASEEPLLRNFYSHHPETPLYRHMERLGIPREHRGLKRTFHSLGHSTATNALKAGVRLDVVRMHMRHADVDQTLAYVTSETEEHQGAVNLMDSQIFPDFYSENSTHMQHNEEAMATATHAGIDKNRSGGGRGEI